ncbi:MAG: hypothetical protein BWY10_00867 [Chloroflexi bacterium ADurb.Bin180]|nr:MAG: hypothetical protein BWY10_00867 [Chloroflexi bacterium ADurb.Bin180]
MTSNVAGVNLKAAPGQLYCCDVIDGNKYLAQSIQDDVQRNFKRDWRGLSSTLDYYVHEIRHASGGPRTRHRLCRLPQPFRSRRLRCQPRSGQPRLVRRAVLAASRLGRRLARHRPVLRAPWRIRRRQQPREHGKLYLPQPLCQQRPGDARDATAALRRSVLCKVELGNLRDSRVPTLNAESRAG